MDKPVYCPKCAHQFAHDYAPTLVPNVPYSFVYVRHQVIRFDEKATTWDFRCGWCETEGEIRVHGE